MTETQKPTQLEIYRGEVLPPEKAQELYSALPSHIKPAVFERNLMNALMANPDLMRHAPRLIFREVAKAAGLGLLLDPILGEAYLVIAYNYKTKQQEPQLRVGYKGMCKLARQTGDVTNIYAHEIHEKDFVEADLGFPKVFHHKPKLFTDRGEVIGYVALIAFKDGSFDFEPMSVDQVHAIRDRSDAYKAFKDGKIKSTPWSTDDGEMSKKTTLRRLLKRQAQSPELVDAIRIEDDAEFPEMKVPALPSTPRDAGPPRAAIEAPAEEGRADDTPRDDGPPGSEAAAGETETPEPAPDKPKRQRASRAKPKETQEQPPTGDLKTPPEPPAEVAPFMVPVEGETFGSWSDKYLAGLETSRTAAGVYKWIELNRQALDKIAKSDNPGAKPVSANVRKAAERLIEKLQPKPETKTKKTPEPDITEVPNEDEPEQVLAWVDAVLASVENADDLVDIYTLKCEPVVDKMFPPDRQEALAIFKRHEQRLGID